jgi:hypothetical protein
MSGGGATVASVGTTWSRSRAATGCRRRPRRRWPRGALHEGEQGAGGLGHVGVDRRVGAALHPGAPEGLGRGQPGAPEDPGQLQAGPVVEAGPGERLADPLGRGGQQRAVGLAHDRAHVHLLEGDHAARPHGLQQASQDGRRVVQVHRDQPVDARVGRGGHGQLGQVLDGEGDVAEAGVAGAALGHRDRLGRPAGRPGTTRRRCRSRGRARAEASPSWRPTMASTASRSAGPAGSAWTVPSVSQSSTARMTGLLRCR